MFRSGEVFPYISYMVVCDGKEYGFCYPFWSEKGPKTDNGYGFQKPTLKMAMKLRGHV